MRGNVRHSHLANTTTRTWQALRRAPPRRWPGCRSATAAAGSATWCPARRCRWRHLRARTCESSPASLGARAGMQIAGLATRRLGWSCESPRHPLPAPPAPFSACKTVTIRISSSRINFLMTILKKLLTPSRVSALKTCTSLIKP